MKKTLSAIILHFLYRGFKSGYKLDKDIKEDLKSLPLPVIIDINVFCEKKPRLTIIIDNNKIRKIKPTDNFPEYERLEITFRCLNDCYSVLFAKESVQSAFLTHKFILKGNIYYAMPVVRVINRIEAYLFPRFITKKLFKKPKLTRNKFRFYLSVLFSL